MDAKPSSSTGSEAETGAVPRDTGGAAFDAASDRSSRSPLSVAILAAVAFMPIVVAAGFLTDRPARPAVPGDISVLALRGALDAAPERRPETPARAGY